MQPEYRRPIRRLPGGCLTVPDGGTLTVQTVHVTGRMRMSNKEQHSNKETKKKPLLTPKEKKAAKKAKKQHKEFMGQ